MNKQILELALQAQLPVIDGEWDYNDREILRLVDGEWRVATPAEIISVLFACEKGREKFAELIVRECMDQCSYTPNSNDEWDKGVKWAYNQIAQHFGVEEK